MNIFEQIAKQLGILPIEAQPFDLEQAEAELHNDIMLFEVNCWVEHILKTLVETNGHQLPVNVINEFQSFDNDKKTAVLIALIAIIGTFIGNGDEEPPDMGVGAFV